MPKFRKRPVVVEAHQFFVGGAWPAGVCCCNRKGMGLHIHTLEGADAVSEGDWIITGADGERYPCKPDMFEATYERVEEEARRG